jgi:LAS superfamily LD-carboxypeptidase LdcB
MSSQDFPVATKSPRGSAEEGGVGIEGVNNRIADIQSRIIALQTQATGTTAKSASTTAATSASSTAFADVLNEAVAGQSPTANKTYTLNSKGIPTDLAAYGNGKIPSNVLGKVGDTGHKLWAPAAESLTNMIADAKKDGVTIGITDSYRSYDEQVDLAKRKGLYSQGGLAAKPGTSEHGWGMAADLDLNSKALTWMRANADRYGFDENVPRESWHWAYKPKTA